MHQVEDPDGSGQPDHHGAHQVQTRLQTDSTSSTPNGTNQNTGGGSRRCSGSPLACSVWSSVGLDLVGTVVVGLAGAIGILYLARSSREGPGAPAGWTLSFLAPMVLLMSARGAFAVPGLRAPPARGSLVVGTASGASPDAVRRDPAVRLVELLPDRPPHPDYRVSWVLPAVSMATCRV